MEEGRDPKGLNWKGAEGRGSGEMWGPGFSWAGLGSEAERVRDAQIIRVGLRNAGGKEKKKESLQVPGVVETQKVK